MTDLAFELNLIAHASSFCSIISNSPINYGPASIKNLVIQGMMPSAENTLAVVMPLGPLTEP